MKQRVISAVVLLAICISCVLASHVTRVLFFCAAGILCAYEYRARMRDKGIRITGWVMYSYLAIQAFLSITGSGLMATMAWFTAGVFIALFSGILHRDVSGEGALFTLAGLSYPCFPFALMMHISVSDRWAVTLLIACLSTWICDAFALFGGKLFGKHKVAPDVSPNKTVEGCICGAVFSLLGGLIAWLAMRASTGITLLQSFATALAASTLGQIGDLAESLIKRYIGVKDFSNLIPGHGGMFDRADRLMFAIPTAYFCLFIFGL